MTISVQIVNNHVKKISDSNTLLDMLIEFDRMLENLDLYSYENWDKGEVIEGPKTDRHFVTVWLMYNYNEMPDPLGAKRLLQRDCLVTYKRDTLKTKVKVKSPDDIITEIKPDGNISYKAKTKTEPVWVVEIKMPRRYVDEFMTDSVEVDEDSYIDAEDMNSESYIDAEHRVTDNEEPQQAPPESGIGGLL